MKHVGKKLLALLLVLSMLSGMSFNNVTIASAEETTAACITLSKNVKKVRITLRNCKKTVPQGFFVPILQLYETC